MSEEEMRFWSKVRIGDGCWEWTGHLDKDGYGTVRRDTKVRKSHRIAWIMANGQTGSLHVLHSCDNPRCVRVGHLFLGTHIDNMADRQAKGRAASIRGESQASSKLTESAVREIRARRACGETLESLAVAYGVTFSTIHKAVMGHTWRHVGERP